MASEIHTNAIWGVVADATGNHDRNANEKFVVDEVDYNFYFISKMRIKNENKFLCPEAAHTYAKHADESIQFQLKFTRSGRR